MLDEADPSLIAAMALGWRLGRLFIRWRLSVQEIGVQRRLEEAYRRSRQSVKLRWSQASAQLRRTAVIRLVLLQRRLDAATVNCVFSYLR